MSNGTEIGVFEAKTNFNKLVHEVERGQQYIITRRGKRVAMIVPLSESRQQEALRALQFIREHRPKYNATVDEIISWRDEGRK
jgi:prevent-host-death family protein